MPSSRRPRSPTVCSSVARAFAALALITLDVGCGSAKKSDAKPARNAAARAESLRAATQAESLARALDEWNVAEVVKRLTEGGLVITDSAHNARLPRLTPTAHVLTVGGTSQLQLFLYESESARARESALLDTAQPPPTKLISWQQRPHYIISGNLIAVIYSPSDRTVERVANVLEARHSKGH